MIQRLMLSFALVIVCSACKGAEEDVFTDFEEIYLAVFTDVIRDYRGSDRVFSVAMSLKNDGNPVGMPDRLWKRLSAMLKSKGVDVSKFVPADEVIWKEEEMHFAHAASQKEVWVYSILGVNWHGTKRLYVSHCKGHGNLAGGGSTLVLEKKRGKWVIIDRIRSWTS